MDIFLTEMKRKTATAPGTDGKCESSQSQENLWSINEYLELAFKVNAVGDEEKTRVFYA